ncbi:hypothetical protein LCGC14_2666700 [marine sediment metagenome]|uniref:Leucine rich repeat variant n=1 Tax=marine sediment metagenome TaxID=412755 RepID=A0A0F8ZQA2_9ZZZZ
MYDTPCPGRNRKPRLDYEELKMQIALGTLPPEYIRAQVHDPEVLDRLANLPDEEVRTAVAVHPKVRLDTLLRLVEDPTTSTPLLVLLAAHSKMTKEVLFKLAEHKDPRVSEEAKGVLFIRSKGHINIQDD